MKNHMNTYNVFVGAFGDETGQRFLRIMHEACETAFEDLYMHSMPQHPARYRGCLERVGAWDMGVIRDELGRLKQKYPDLQDVFKSTFISYAKSMRGAKSMRLIINLPKLETVLHCCFVHFSKNKFVRDAHYFKSPSVLERRVVCMDSLRDCFFDHVGDEFVKLEEVRPAHDPDPAAAAKAPSVVASSVVREHSVHRAEDRPVEANARKETSVVSLASMQRGEADDAETRVVSNIFEDRSVAGSNAVNDDACSSIGPEDSVSCADFADKQHRQLNQMRRDRFESIPEDDQASRTSLSLSSVSITQNGFVPKKPPHPPSNASSVSRTSSHMKGMTAPQSNHDAPFDEDSTSEVSAREETVSEASMARAKRTSGARKSPPKSYVTSLEDSDAA